MADDTNFLELSDDDFAKLTEPEFAEPDPPEDPEPEPEPPGEPEGADDPPEEPSEGGDDPESPALPDVSDTTDPPDDEAPTDPPEAGDPEDPPRADAPPKAEETPPEADAFDYKAAYEQMMAPFKANGREIVPKSPADLKRLQEMGANYHEKMAGLKPARKALKTLENAGLLDDEKLSFLIDVHNGKPEAIARLLKEKGIDPEDVDVEAESNYAPINHVASDAELEVDTLLESIQHSPNYSKTLTTVTQTWDQASQDQVAAHPQIISIINGQMDSGVYDVVMDAVRYERSMGLLVGLSDLEAYKAMGNKLEAEGAFTPTNPPPPETVVVPPPPPKVDPAAEQRKAQKKAAGPTGTPRKVGRLPRDFNPLDLSDEDFAKFDKSTIGL